MEVYKGPPTEQGSDVPGLNGTWQHTNSLSWLHSVSIIPFDIGRYLYDFITWTYSWMGWRERGCVRMP
jgi:hypothetical protein